MNHAIDQEHEATIASAAVHDRQAPLTVDNVSKSFMVPSERVATFKERVLRPGVIRKHRFDALKKVSFDVQPGEFFGVVGRNGSGKSTLLKCMAGIYRPNTGSITVNGRLATFIELGVGFNPDLNAYDNVLLNGTLMGLSPSEAKSRVESVLAFGELEEFADLKLRNYSSGMHVRLAFAVAISIDADILLIDEVLAVGDLAFQQKCFDEFNRIKESGTTVVFVTHAMDLVERFCDRAMIIEKGVVQEIGDPAAVAMRYEQINVGKMADVEFERGTHVGDGAAEILDAWFENDDGLRTEETPQGDFITLFFECRFNVDTEAPVLGFIMHDEANRPIFATDTRIDRVETGSFAAGQTAKFSMRFRSSLERGLFYCSPSVLHKADSRVADSVDHACRLHVLGPRHRAGGVALIHETSVVRG
ncbi:MAG: ABC transporter ATP-binding protein [Actinobacteria bacterium]|nr:ABC transporter ATP-binding protein [Actinomycetota bacterium]